MGLRTICVGLILLGVGMLTPVNIPYFGIAIALCLVVGGVMSLIGR